MEQIWKWLYPSIWVVLGVTPPAIIFWFQTNIAQSIEGVPTLRIVQVGVALLLVATASIAYIFYLRPWLRWDVPTGTWVSRFTDIRYCGTCRTKKVISPLKNEITGWRCVACNTFRKDPARKAKEPDQPPSPPQPSGPQAWMAR
jgi:hypothetical protein